MPVFFEIQMEWVKTGNGTKLSMDTNCFVIGPQCKVYRTMNNVSVYCVNKDRQGQSLY